MPSESPSPRPSFLDSLALYIVLDVGLGISLLFFSRGHWEAIGASGLREHLFLPAVAVLFVYGTAIATAPRRRRFLVERVCALGLLLGGGYLADGPLLAFLRFAFMEIIALSISLGLCLIFYRFFFDFFGPETLAKSGWARFVAMMREYWTQGYVLPIIVFGVPLVVWSGFALRPLFAHFVSHGPWSVASGALALGLQIHARWGTIYRFLERNTRG